MKSRITKCTNALALFAMLIFPVALAAQTYNVVKLDGLGGDAGANGINDRGFVVGQANKEGNNVSRAVLWIRGSSPIDLGTLGGPDTNSAVAWPVKSNTGLIVGISDTNEDNPLGEFFSCYPFFATGAPTGKICRGFRWEKGEMIALPPFPGGYNSYATAANNRGPLVAGAATVRFLRRPLPQHRVAVARPDPVRRLSRAGHQPSERRFVEGRCLARSRADTAEGRAEQGHGCELTARHRTTELDSVC